MELIKTYKFPDRNQWRELLARPGTDDTEKEQKVSAMLQELRSKGWKAVEDYTVRFDGNRPDPVWVSKEQFIKAESTVSQELKDAIGLAAANIRVFHESQRRRENHVSVKPGIECYQRWFPIERVGLYVPGGTAPLISTVLMLAIPANLAGCGEIVLCTPANSDGEINPAILYAARYCGVEKVARLGGVQAIGSMAYGLGEIPKVDKIFGPGNSWVTMAKQLVTHDGVAIDMPAGPSEVAVIADETCNPAFVAADLLSQAEHGIDSQSILITRISKVAMRVEHELLQQVQGLPRKEIALAALSNSRIFVLPDDDEVIDLVNLYAPEHLIITTKNYNNLANRITNAGSVFLGQMTPESSGDYASGTNHTLPTSGYARAYSGLSLDSFMKSITYQELTIDGLRHIGDAIISLAKAEGLEAHARAVQKRLDGMKDSGSVTASQKADLVGGAEKIATSTRPNIRNLKPYSSARDEYSGDSAMFLDANENPVETGLNRYPDPRQRKLVVKIAEMKKIDPAQIFLGNGSDEAIDLLFRIFCEPGNSRAITMSPTYGMYRVCARIQDVEVDEVLLNNDFSLNTKAMLDAVRWNTRLIFICSPNNPTGNHIPLDNIRLLAERFTGLVVVDEAYIDFTSHGSAIELLHEMSNIVVLQTFSKAWGLAGVRLGMAFASSEIINLMNKVKYPYNVNVLSARAAMNAIEEEQQIENDDEDKVRDSDSAMSVAEILRERELLNSELNNFPFVVEVYPSDANFLLVRMLDARSVYLYLTKQGIVVRDRSSQPLCENCLRITVGTHEENRILLETIKQFEN